MKNIYKKSYMYKESKCVIVTDKKSGIEVATESIEHNRSELEKYIASNPKFLESFEPLAIPEKPLVARLMAEAAQVASVGPMAAVAGVIADLAVQDMTNDGCKVAVIEDGGEISAISHIPIDVALAAGEEPLSRKFGFRLSNFPIGLATSSGRFSHAFSFGEAEAATVFCKTAGLADAVATAVANVVKGEDTSSAIKKGMEVAMSINEVDGVLILYKGQVGTSGNIPQIIKVKDE